jgi:hypothetical protein
MLIKYQIQNTFKSVTGNTFSINEAGINNFDAYKSIVFPINTDFFPVDYGEDVQDIVLSERKKAINPAFDAETTKYKFSNILANVGVGLLLNFRFWDMISNSYTVSYAANGITTTDVNNHTNGFKKSFFRLYFYSTNSGDTNNLIFTEDLNVEGTIQPTIPFNRLYWLRNDEYFVNNNNNKIVYMEARFFNAKTGKITKFINIPLSITNSFTGAPISVNQYKNNANRSWRTSAVELLNPKLNNGEYNFRPYTPFGANTPTVITLSEFIML